MAILYVTLVRNSACHSFVLPFALLEGPSYGSKRSRSYKPSMCRLPLPMENPFYTNGFIYNCFPFQQRANHISCVWWKLIRSGFLNLRKVENCKQIVHSLIPDLSVISHDVKCMKATIHETWRRIRGKSTLARVSFQFASLWRHKKINLLREWLNVLLGTWYSCHSS